MLEKVSAMPKLASLLGDDQVGHRANQGEVAGQGGRSSQGQPSLGLGRQTCGHERPEEQHRRHVWEMKVA